MKTIKETNEAVEKVLEGALDGLYAVKFSEHGETWYAFASVDEDYEVWPLGIATEDEDGGFSGTLDTRPVYFADDDQLADIVFNRKREALYIVEA